jgi:ankyrin repeat protein
VYRTTPLHYAAAEGHIDVCKTLLEFRPAAVQIEDCNGKTAFDYACQERYMEIGAMILQVLSGLRDGAMYV